MNKYFSIGPSQIHSNLKDDLNLAVNKEILSLPHRSKEFEELYKSIKQNLSNLLNLPDSYKIIFYGSSTECMERIIQGVVIKSSFHFVNGAFAKRFHKFAEDYDKSCGLQQIWVENKEWFEWEKAFSPVKSPWTEFLNRFYYKNTFSSTTLKDSELVTLTMVESSTGAQLDFENIKKIKLSFPNVLTAVDIAAAFPIIKTDFNYIDLGFFSTQKLLGLPAGLGVLILSPQAVEKINYIGQNLYNLHDAQPGSYFGLQTMLELSEKNQTPQTPNVLAMFLLNKRLENILQTGLKKLRQASDQKKSFLYDYFENNSDYEFLVHSPQYRSETVLALKPKKMQPAEIYTRLAEKGFIISQGYGSYKNKIIRIANYPTTTLEDTQNLLAEFDKISLKS